ncbi:MAG TPA: hypothetical protein PLU72_14705 [Candidatus Ozemobacteraceae bacterium]|nr:hypothetical protein [Candidatus Ozemobacteraceae bacterium]HQG28031.1 hypothetical protein [Candidatus Ozemobacteraceae bacterium]
MKRRILTGLMAIAISVPCWAQEIVVGQADQSDQATPVSFQDPFGQGGYGRPPEPRVPVEVGQQNQGQQAPVEQSGQVDQAGKEDSWNQSGQCGQAGQSDKAGQSDQAGQCGQTDSYGYPGQSGQSNQAGQYGQSGHHGHPGQSNGGCYGRPDYDPAKLQTVISLLSMIESDLAMCAGSTGHWGRDVMAIGHINNARSALERAPMHPAWRPLLAEIHDRLGRIRFHLLMNDDATARMMMGEVQAIVRSTKESLLINAGVRVPGQITAQRPRVVVMPQIPTGGYGSNYGNNQGSGWGSAWGSGWSWGNGNGTQLPGGTMRPAGPEYPALPPTNEPPRF